MALAEAVQPTEIEYKSDTFGERGVLLGAVHGTVESLYRWFVCHGYSPEQAYLSSVESITGPINQLISKDGILAIYHLMDEQEKQLFKQAYSAAYHPMFEILMEIYSEVESGNEIRSVIAADTRHQHHRRVAFMVDNCSTTARLGARKWAPRFDYILCQQALIALDNDVQPNEELFNRFLTSDVHRLPHPHSSIPGTPGSHNLANSWSGFTPEECVMVARKIKLT